MKKQLTINDEQVEIDILDINQKEVKFKLNDFTYHYNLIGHIGPTPVLGEEERRFHPHIQWDDDGRAHIVIDGAEVRIESIGRMKTRKRTVAEESMSSPMPGKILKVMVESGDLVKKGDILLVMEAMKMEHSIKASSDGEIAKVLFAEGDQVEGGVPLIEMKEEKEC